MRTLAGKPSRPERIRALRTEARRLRQEALMQTARGNTAAALRTLDRQVALLERAVVLESEIGKRGGSA